MWYLIGWVRKYNEVRTFGLDRIMEIEPSDETLFMTPEQAQFNPEEFYHYCIGVSALNQKPEDVILSFDTSANIICAKRILC
jgi:predicted DNA-binding transcriptional regulator YafY